MFQVPANNQDPKFSYFMYVPIVGVFTADNTIDKIEQLISDRTLSAPKKRQLQNLQIQCLRAVQMQAVFLIAWAIVDIAHRVFTRNFSSFTVFGIACDAVAIFGCIRVIRKIETEIAGIKNEMRYVTRPAI